MVMTLSPCIYFFLNDPATPENYTLSLHDALPISRAHAVLRNFAPEWRLPTAGVEVLRTTDRKSTRLNSSYRCISYAVFCLKKKKVRWIMDLEQASGSAGSAPVRL